MDKIRDFFGRVIGFENGTMTLSTPEGKLEKISVSWLTISTLNGDYAVEFPGRGKEEDFLNQQVHYFSCRGNYELTLKTGPDKGTKLEEVLENYSPRIKSSKSSLDSPRVTV